MFLHLFELRHGMFMNSTVMYRKLFPEPVGMNHLALESRGPPYWTKGYYAICQRLRRYLKRI